jgi:ABC-2 type transport system permease protein
MTGAMLRLELRRVRLLVGSLVVMVALYAAVMARVYPYLRANTALLDEYVKTFPKGFLSAIGMTGSLSDPGVFYTTYVGSLLWPFAAGIAAIVLATRPVAADLDRGYLELTLATPLSRARLLAVAIVGQAAALVVLAVVMIGAVLAAGATVNAGFSAERFALAAPFEIAFGFAIAGPTTLLSVVTLSRGRSAGIAAGALIAMYLIRIVVGLEPDLSWLGGLSIFTYGDLPGVVGNGTFPVGDTLFLAGIGVASWAAALGLFRRRDLAA